MVLGLPLCSAVMRQRDARANSGGALARPSLVHAERGRGDRLAVRRPQLRQFAPCARNPSRPFLIPGERSDREWTRPTFGPALPARGSARWVPCPANIRGFPPTNSPALVGFSRPARRLRTVSNSGEGLQLFTNTSRAVHSAVTSALHIVRSRRACLA